MTEECKEAILAYSDNPDANVWNVILSILIDLESYKLRHRAIYKKIYDEIHCMNNHPTKRFVPNDNCAYLWNEFSNAIFILVNTDFMSIDRNYEPYNPKYAEEIFDEESDDWLDEKEGEDLIEFLNAMK